jgi:signal transduction histidine kinase
VFDRFYRIAGNGFGKGLSGGLGMGLAIAKGIVAAHGGCIWIEDAKTGTGARIVFTVPVADTDENLSRSARGSEEAQRKSEPPAVAGG